MFKILILSLSFIASISFAQEQNEKNQSTAQSSDGTVVTVSAGDRVVNGNEEEGKPSDQKAKDEDIKETQDELENKDGGTADVQVVYRINGEIDSELKQTTESGISTAFCDPDFDRACEEEVSISARRERLRQFDVISHEVINSENGDAPEESRLNRETGRSTEVVYRNNEHLGRSTEVVYRNNGDPAYDRSHRIQLRERGTDKIYIATMREVSLNRESDREVNQSETSSEASSSNDTNREEKEAQEETSGSDKTMWLSRLAFATLSSF